jgi:hypothetical protein
MDVRDMFQGMNMTYTHLIWNVFVIKNMGGGGHHGYP